MDTLNSIENKRVLICSGIQVFPAESGGHWRTASLCKRLAEKNEVVLHSLTGRKKDYLKGAKSGVSYMSHGLTEYVDRNRVSGFLQWASYRLGLPPLWLTALALLWPSKALRAELSKADVVVIDFPYLFPLWRHTRGLNVLNTHNVEHRLAKPWLRPLVQMIEKHAASICDTVLACSREDREWFDLQLGFARKTEIFKNGADPKRFQLPAGVRRQTRESLGFKPDEKVILFAGSSFQPNIEALSFLKIFCKKNETDLAKRKIRFLVIGTVSESFTVPGILALGKVESVEPYFVACDAAINPVETGSGTNVKMYEYLAAGLPVFSTFFGARGIEFPPQAQHFSFDKGSLLNSLLSFAS